MLLHLDRVRDLVCPPSRAKAPWSECVISVGDDGALGVISVKEKKLVRLLSGNPPNEDLQITFDAKRYPSCPHLP